MSSIKFVFFSVLLFSNVVRGDVCKFPLKWEFKKVGSLSNVGVFGPTDFVFLSKDEILLINFPEQDKLKASLQIYEKNKEVWSFGQKLSKYLPATFHGRHVFKADIGGDKTEEVIISDHGTDRPPFPGAPIVILEKKKKNWKLHPISKEMPVTTNFNSAFIKLSGDRKAIFRASMNSGDSTLFEFKKEWVNTLSTLPKELTQSQMCMMTTLSEDFDGDGSDDLFLGGCDRNQDHSFQRHDRILTNVKGHWVLLPPNTLPARQLNSTWGTVYVEKINYNNDNKPDLIVSTHDFGFHSWRVVIYENQSTPGKFLFREVLVPISQEHNTEGFLNSFEITSLPGYKNLILADVRSVLRDKNRVHPKQFIRFLIQEKNQLEDASHCLPSEISKNLYKIRRFPESNNEFLLVPFHGDIIHLKLKLK